MDGYHGVMGIHGKFEVNHTGVSNRPRCKPKARWPSRRPINDVYLTSGSHDRLRK
jgi:hypothetical protein